MKPHHDRHFVYEIRSERVDGVYYGICVDPSSRWKQHLSASAHSAYPLYVSMRENGTDDFSIKVLEEFVKRKDALAREQELILNDVLNEKVVWNLMSGRSKISIFGKHSYKILSEIDQFGEKEWCKIAGVDHFEFRKYSIGLSKMPETLKKYLRLKNISRKEMNPEEHEILTERVKDLAKKGYGIKDIANDTSENVAYISKILKSENVKTIQSSKLDPKSRLELHSWARDRANGDNFDSTALIAKKFGISRQAVYLVIKKYKNP